MRAAETWTPTRLEVRLDRERKARLEAEAIAEDVTRRLYETVKELEASKAELERLLGAQREFIAIAAHELQTPVTPIAAFAQMLLEAWSETPDEDKRRRIEVIDRQARRLRRLTKLMLALSRIEAGRLSVRPAEIDLGEAIGRTVGELAEGRFDVVVGCEADLMVVADPDHLQTIVSNLVENAFKHGSPPVAVEAHRAERWVEVRVRDRGPGVPDDFVPRLFGKFAQAGFGSNKSSNGTGLGLYIVRNLSRSNGGDVWYEQSGPEGACFVVRLPCPQEG